MADFYTPGAEIPSVSTIPSTDDIVNALKGFGQTAMSVPIINSAVHGFTAAHDASQSTPENPYTTDKAIHGAQDMMTLMGGASPAGVESGAAGIFGGRLAKNLDRHAFEEARLADSLGYNPADIYEQHGFWRGPVDEKWRFEINDSGAAVSPKGTVTWPDGTVGIPDQTSVGAAYHHPELYKAYPQLADMPLVPAENGLLGYLSHGGWEGGPTHIGIRQGIPVNQFKDVMTHELQHAVQGIEGFPKGANPVQFYPPGYEDLRNKLIESNGKWSDFFNQAGLAGDEATQHIIRFLNGAPESPIVNKAIDVVRNTGRNDPFSKWLESHQYAMKNFEQPANLSYRMTPGELEASNVQLRRPMTDVGRKFTPPWITEQDVVHSIYNPK